MAGVGELVRRSGQIACRNRRVCSVSRDARAEVSLDLPLRCTVLDTLITKPPRYGSSRNATQTSRLVRSGGGPMWLANLRPHADAAAIEQLLAPKESAKAREFQRERNRDRYIRTASGLRTILAHYLGIAPGEIECSHGPPGKPELVARALRFNLSRSNDLVVRAITSGTLWGWSDAVISTTSHREMTTS
jgi:hypothetical protein